MRTKKHSKIKLTDYIIRLNPNAEWVKDESGWIDNPYLYLTEDNGHFGATDDPRQAASYILFSTAQDVLDDNVPKDKWPDAKIIQRVIALQE